jgi:hypothetical protein
VVIEARSRRTGNCSAIANYARFTRLGVREQGDLVSAELEEMMVTRDATRDESQVGQGLGGGVV